MGLFSFLKPKKNNLDELLHNLSNSMFPKGEKDITAGAEELLNILNNKIDKNEAILIFKKSTVISRVSEEFDKERLKRHLEGYCLPYFDEMQLDQFYRYLIALKAAMMINRRTPSEVRRDGDAYFW